MLRHQLDPGHERLDVPGCYACKISGVQFAPSSMPSRGKGARAARINATDSQWERDMAAYKRLVADGVQPPQIDGCAVVEREATSRIQVEYGLDSVQAAVEAKYGTDMVEAKPGTVVDLS